MREYKQTDGSGIIVDLDNPDTYTHLPDNLKELDDMMFKEIGQALVYMDYFRREIFPKSISYTKPDNSGFSQRKRVNDLIKKFAEDRHNNYQNKMWYKEQIFLFQDETENMC